MTNDQDLLDRFHTVEVPVSQLTVESVVTAGRRRRTRRRALRAGCGAALAVSALVVAPRVLPVTDRGAMVDTASGNCTVTRLATPAGMTNVWARAVDPTGRHIVGDRISGPADTEGAGRRVTGTAPSQPVLWTDGRVTALPAPLRVLQPTGVNASGVVVAVGGRHQRFESLLRYVGGAWQEAALPAGRWELRPYAKINARGDVMVTAVPLGKGGTEGVVLLWKAGASRATRAPLPVGVDGKAFTDGGEIVGDLLSRAGEPTAYVWDERGERRELPTPYGERGSVNTGRGDWVVGNLWPSGVVVRWRISTGEMTSSDVHAPGQAVNGRGWTIGDTALRRDDGVVVPLTGGGVPLDIADDGTVVGAIVATDGSDVVSQGPVSWHCA